VAKRYTLEQDANRGAVAGAEKRKRLFRVGPHAVAADLKVGCSSWLIPEHLQFPLHVYCLSVYGCLPSPCLSACLSVCMSC